MPAFVVRIPHARRYVKCQQDLVQLHRNTDNIRDVAQADGNYFCRK